ECRSDEPDRVNDERVALPASHRMPQVRDIKLCVCTALAVIGWDDAIFAISAAGIAPLIDERDVILRLVDASGRALPRNSQGLAGHDRIVLVRPHVELLNFVPVLRFVQWTTPLSEPRRRVELEIFSLIGSAVTGFLLRRTTSPAAVPHVVSNPVRVLPVAGQVRMRARPRR